VWLFEAATRTVPIAPTLCARTTGAAAAVGDGVGVVEGEADGEAVAAAPVLVPPHAARRSAALTTRAVAQPILVTDVIMGVGTEARYG
jgi:hypothetical protein